MSSHDDDFIYIGGACLIGAYDNEDDDFIHIYIGSAYVPPRAITASFTSHPDLLAEGRR